MKAPRILLSLLFSSLLLQAHALITTDRKQRLTEHWEFIRQDMGSIWEDVYKRQADGPLFQTLRNEIEGYRFDAPQGVYEIELLFTDIFRRNAGIAYQPVSYTHLDVYKRQST